MDYEEAKRLAGSPDPAQRRALATEDRAAPELLYFLARDADVAVRLAVAGNHAAPREADLILARDPDDAVRERVGQKLGEPRPNHLTPISQRKQAITAAVAETLAGDEAGTVREAIAHSLKDSVDAPAHVVKQLAKDVEISVAGPVLQHSPVLDDTDLIEVMESAPIRGVLNAIAKRRNISAGVSEIVVNQAIARPDEASAVGDLLANETAKIAGGTMDRIIDAAPAQPDWHRPLAGRKDLSGEHMTKVAAIPSDAIAETMSARSDLDGAALNALSNMVARRMAELQKKRAAEQASSRPPAADAFLDAVMKGGKVGPVSAAIALRAGIATEVTARILTSRNSKALVSLAWKAGLSPLQALALQTRVGGISEDRALHPTPAGGFPLSPSDMDWQLGLYVASALDTSNGAAARSA
jgi:uncharacterized protein (DUF2336 family)